MRYTYQILIFCLFFSSCKKKCYTIYDDNGSTLGEICARNENRFLKKLEKDYNCGNKCSSVLYEETNSPKLCWKYNDSNDNTKYIMHLTELWANEFYNNPLEVECDNCQGWITSNWYHLKSTNEDILSQKIAVDADTYLCGDTINTLYEGRQINIRENLDTIFYITFEKLVE